MNWKPLALFALATCLATVARADTGTHTYDFGYQIQGDPRVAPAQVFDDGKRTFLQLPRTDPMPAIFAVTSAGQVLLPGRPEGQFTVVERVEKQWLLTLGASRATIKYSGAARREDPPALFGAATPVKTTGAAPIPVPAAQIIAGRTAAPEPPRPPSLPTSPAGTPPADPVPPAPAAAEPPVTTWAVRMEDRTISATLSRWAKDAGWAFSWDAPRDFPTAIPAVFSEPFERAVLDVVMAYSTSDSPIKAEFARFGSNKVLRIIKYTGNSHD